MERLCDLHLHSTCSDGSLPPEEVAEAAWAAGLAAAILTDHNTIAGVEDFQKAGAARGIETAAGMEISCEYREQEVHILALFLPEAGYPAVRHWLAGWEAGRQHSHEELARRLTEAGLPVNYKELEQKYSGSRINRVHFARELCAAGYCRTVSEAFERYLDPEHGLYQPAPRPSMEEAIASIRSWKALPVLAHPPVSLPEDWLPLYVQEAARAGAAAAETRYSTYTEAQQQLMQRLCRENGLLESGGSDFHGSNKPNIAIGRGTGTLRVPYALFSQLKERNQKWNG